MFWGVIPVLESTYEEIANLGISSTCPVAYLFGDKFRTPHPKIIMQGSNPFRYRLI